VLRVLFIVLQNITRSNTVSLRGKVIRLLITTSDHASWESVGPWGSKWIALKLLPFLTGWAFSVGKSGDHQWSQLGSQGPVNK
jgi:hypothetical protein